MATFQRIIGKAGSGAILTQPEYELLKSFEKCPGIKKGRKSYFRRLLLPPLTTLTSSGYEYTPTAGRQIIGLAKILEKAKSKACGGVTNGKRGYQPYYKFHPIYGNLRY